MPALRAPAVQVPVRALPSSRLPSALPPLPSGPRPLRPPPLLLLPLPRPLPLRLPPRPGPLWPSVRAAHLLCYLSPAFSAAAAAKWGLCPGDAVPDAPGPVSAACQVRPGVSDAGRCSAGGIPPRFFSSGAVPAAWPVPAGPPGPSAAHSVPVPPAAWPLPVPVLPSAVQPGPAVPVSLPERAFLRRTPS